jgi:hypothetical protein
VEIRNIQGVATVLPLKDVAKRGKQETPIGVLTSLQKVH